MTIAKNREKNKKGTLPDFIPVPRARIRHDGWTDERQRNFIEALADLGSVKAAAHRVNMTPEGAYLLRRHPEADGFRKAWEAALACGIQRLEDIALDRALHGVEVPIYCYGKVAGTRTVYNDALLMFLLRNRAPKRFTADSWQNADAATQSQVKRLRTEWRAEWEAERQAAEADDDAEVLASIDAALDRMRANREARRSPRVKALHAEIARVEAEEQAAGYLPWFGHDEDGDEEDGEAEADWQDSTPEPSPTDPDESPRRQGPRITIV